MGFVCLVAALISAMASRGAAQDAPMSQSAGPKTRMPDATKIQPTDAPATQDKKPAAEPAPALPPPAPYDPAIFERPFAPAQLAFLKQYDGAPSSDLYRDKEFHKLLKSVVPDCTYRYGRDMPLSQALDMVMEGSRVPVQVREGRYVLVSGLKGPFLSGRGFLWFDLQEGVALGGFFFTPTNGEPTPVLNVFSRMIREDGLSLGELPPGFAQDLSQWTLVSGVPPVTMRYFLTGSNRKIVLEHDEDYCLAWDGTRLPADSGCEEMAADAADKDLTGAYFTDATHHVTNATAYMLNQDQVAFISVRDNTCRVGPDPLGCRIRLTREQTRIIVRRGPPRPVRR
jgi:hypothetical protein